jgi:hypothetical protein
MSFPVLKANHGPRAAIPDPARIVLDSESGRVDKRPAVTPTTGHLVSIEWDKPERARPRDPALEDGDHLGSHREGGDIRHRSPANVAGVVTRARGPIVDRHEQVLVNRVRDAVRHDGLATEVADDARLEAGFLPELAQDCGLVGFALLDPAAGDRPGAGSRLAGPLDEEHAAPPVDDYGPDGHDCPGRGLRGTSHERILSLAMIGLEFVRPLEADWRATLDAMARARGWPSSRDVAKLGASVAALSTAYNDPARARASMREAGAARLGFAFPRDVAKGAGAVRELLATGGLPSEGALRVLDLGAGLGAMTWGLVRALRAAGSRAEVQATWVDSDSEAIELGLEIVRERARESEAALGVRAVRGTLDAAADLGPFDVVLLGNVLSELSVDSPDDVRLREHVALVSTLLERSVRDGGAIVVVEPALRARTRHLHKVRDGLCRQGASVFAPCLHQSPCPALTLDSDWCHEALAVDLPDWLVPVARAAGLRFERLTFSYLVLGKGRPSLRDSISVPGTAGRLRVVSEVIASKGKSEVFMCGDFSSPGALGGGVAARARVSRLRRDERGDSALARWADLAHGELLVIDPAPALAGPRVGRADRVELVKVPRKPEAG